MGATTSYLAVDAGRGRTTVRLVTPDGVRDEQRPGLLPGSPLPPQWADVIRSVLADQPDAHPTAVALGSSGLGHLTAHDALPLLAGTGITSIAVAHNSVTSYLGALGTDKGCVIAASTGAICLAVGEHDVARVDGWGHLMGDAGSAYWIGRTALEAAMRGYDGRRQLTALTDAVAAAYPDIETAYAELAGDPEQVRRIADFAEQVVALAPTDRVAANILDKAAAHLSEAVQAAIRRVGLSGPETPHVVAIGHVFESDRVRTRFCDYLTLQWPSFALIEPKGTMLDGTAALLELPVSSPLHQHVTYAEHG